MQLSDAIQKFRYIIDIDGICTAFRLQWTLGKNVVVIKPLSIERQWYSTALRPWVHYVPVNLKPYEISYKELSSAYRSGRRVKQTSNLRQVLEWASNNSEITYQIMQSANLFHFDYDNLLYHLLFIFKKNFIATL